MMNKCTLIKKILRIIEEEIALTKRTEEFTSHKEAVFQPEKIYFDLIRYIITVESIPNNVSLLQVYIDHDDKVRDCEIFTDKTNKELIVKMNFDND